MIKEFDDPKFNLKNCPICSGKAALRVRESKRLKRDGTFYIINIYSSCGLRIDRTINPKGKLTEHIQEIVNNWNSLARKS